jgi:hypothetical protein
VVLFDSAFEGKALIEYLTEYSEPASFASHSRVVAKRVHHNRASLNILREKLKRRGGTEQKFDRKGVRKD